MENEKNSFFVNGNSREVALKLAKVIDCTNSDNTGTGVEKELDISELDSDVLAKIGLDVNDISEVFTVSLLHRNRLASEMIMLFCGRLEGMRALVIGFRSKPNISEVIPWYLEGPINPDNIVKAGLTLIN